MQWKSLDIESKGTKIYFESKVEDRKSDDKVVNTVFPISFFEVAWAPERKPVEDPDNVSDQSEG